jgi:mono/diheme cytochrome c family protein
MKTIYLLAAVLLVSSANAEPRTTLEGVYSKGQAKQGGELYKAQCLVCHDKKYFRPVLTRWNGQSAAVLFDVMSGSMPESNPGGLQLNEYVDILAYIFSLSKYPSGDKDLERENLVEITLLDP